MSRRHRRARGATYTLAVIGVSMLLMVAGTAFVDPSRKTLDVTSFRERQACAREAALAGLEWARAAAESNAAAAKGTAELKLLRANATATFERASGELRVEATATSGTRDAVTVRARALVKDGRLASVQLASR